MKLYSQKTEIEPKAGEKYKAKANYGYRYILVDQVRKSRGQWQPYALAHEVNSEGESSKGWLHGMLRDWPLKIQLTYRDEMWRMPINYEKIA